jgi:branched-chain amino acid transport system substrate-binding protein
MSNDKPIRIGYGISLSGPLGSNGRTAHLAHQIWQDDVNRKGGLLGRNVEMVAHDDRTDPGLVPAIYSKLLGEERVDVVMGGYGDNSISPAMPQIIEHKRYLVGLMALAVNASFRYPNYFSMIPTGPNPGPALSEGFFEIAARQSPRPKTVSILVADAPFSRSPTQGAKDNAAKHRFSIVSEARYPLTTTDFATLIREVGKVNPDILFLCSYLNDSVGLVKAIHEVGLEPKLVGGAMIGPQNGTLKAQLGPLLNGLVNYEYWLPVAKLSFPGVTKLIAEYQSRAAGKDVDPLGYYVVPQAYAQMQVIEQAIRATGSLGDEQLAAYTRTSLFSTVVGDVRFGEGGGWVRPRVLQTQFQNIEGTDIGAFRDMRTQVVVSPNEFASGDIVYPYAKAKQPLNQNTGDRR